MSHSTDSRTLYATDLDGTLLRSDGSISARTVAALSTIREHGHIVVFATGRPPRQMPEIGKATGHTGYSVGLNGALLYDHSTNSVVATNPFSPPVAGQIIDELHASIPDITIAVETLDGLFSEPEYPDYETTLTTDLTNVTSDILQILAWHPEHRNPELAAQVLAAVGNTAEVTWGMSGHVQLNSPGVNKGTTLARLVESYGLTSDSVVAFGDMPNDLPMLRWAGSAYAMAGAHPVVLAEIFERAPNNDSDGVASVLEATVAQKRQVPLQVTESPTFSFAVITHPKRFEEAKAFQASYPELDIEIVTDPHPDGPPTAIRTESLAWELAPENATHRVVFQDDVFLCDWFQDGLNGVVSAAPHAAISLFAEWGTRAATALRLAAVLGYRFSAMANTYTPTQALVMPTEMGRGYAQYVRTNEPDCLEDDQAMARYLAHCGADARITVPNLAEDKLLPSIHDNEHLGVRRSTCYQQSASPLPEWRSATFSPRTVPFLCGRTHRARCLIRPRESRATWYTVSARQLLRERGHDLDGIVHTMWHSVDRSGARREIQDTVSPWHLYEAWMMAYTFGVVLADDWPRDGDAAGWFDTATQEPWAALALSTMAPGALRNHAPMRVMPSLRVIHADAVRLGFCTTATAPTVPGRPA